MNANDNGNGGKAAFARAASEDNGSQAGLTKREYFAGLALQGILAYSFNGSEIFGKPDVAAQNAVMYADHLLAELAKGGQ